MIYELLMPSTCLQATAPQDPDIFHDALPMQQIGAPSSACSTPGPSVETQELRPRGPRDLTSFTSEQIGRHAPPPKHKTRTGAFFDANLLLQTQPVKKKNSLKRRDPRVQRLSQYTLFAEVLELAHSSSSGVPSPVNASSAAHCQSVEKAQADVSRSRKSEEPEEQEPEVAEAAPLPAGWLKASHQPMRLDLSFQQGYCRRRAPIRSRPSGSATSAH